MKIRYFDHAATTPVRDEVIKEIIPYLGVEYGNPSSIYTLGRHNKKAVEESRKKVAKAINANANEIYFTSCGSESDNLALKGIMLANKEKGKHLITTKIEHPAILNTCKWLEKNGYDVTYLNVDKTGKISLSELKNSIRLDTVLISIMFANNEIGTIQPIKEIGKIAKANGIIFHTDAVQAIGNVKIDVQDLNIDALSMSGHKIYAPKGIGALYVKNGIKFEKIQHGGHQENNKRAGTENVASIVGLGRSIELIYSEFEEYNTKLINLREYYISQIEKNFKNVILNGDRIDRLPGNANVSFKGIDAGELLLKLDSYGICASAGSACTSGSLEPSHVLLAIGLKEEYAQGSLRVSFGKDNTKEDVEYLINCIKKSVMLLS
ncbi:MAG: cysteine desulfurase NifS [Clostridia bacterium]|nr:cysteine desulfurase NifS [Clostridia bacterium]